MANKVIGYKEYLALIGYKPKETRSRYEVSDPVPMEPPLGYNESPDLMEQIRMMIRRENFASDNSPIDETFEEADDFDTGEDDPLSPYEEDFEPTVFVKAPTPAERAELAEGVEPIATPSSNVSAAEGGGVAEPSQTKAPSTPPVTKQ